MDAATLRETLARYDQRNLTLCSIGSHSALEVAAGAQALGMRNLIVTERGRDEQILENIIEPILAALLTEIRHHSDTSPV